MRDPVSEAARCEAQGLVEDLDEGLGLLEQAQQRWERLGRPLDGARCLARRAERLLERDEAGAQALGEAAAGMFEQLEVVHMATRPRELGRA
jgi:hypothetical protein